MAAIHPLSADKAVVTVGATGRYTFRLGALDMLLNGAPDLKVARVPLQRTRDEEAGTITLSKTGKTALVDVHDLGRLYLCKADLLRAFLRKEIALVSLLDVTEKG